EYEEEVYRRLGKYTGIVSIVNLDETGITMELLSNGNLRVYLQKQREVPNSTKFDWFLDMARTLTYIHNHRVVVADISTTNFLLAEDLSIKFSDFGEASIFTLDTDMTVAEEGGFSTCTDIGQLGAAIYEVVTGEHCRFDLFGDSSSLSVARWPSRNSLPSTEGVWLGDIIEACWTKGIQSASELLARLDKWSQDRAL
ncbi:kinase-like domain-containing protein, partial [Delphinella strobiligena]